MHLMKKIVDLDSLPVLYGEPFTEESLARDFEVRGGEWDVEDGWLTGRNRGNFPGMVISRRDFPGPVMLDFEARTMPPCTHDINWMWSGSWDEKTNTRGLAYVAGLQGWWDGKIGFEKSPDYRLNCGTQYLRFEPGRTYHIQSGSIGGHIFCAVDGTLALEVTDPDPIDQNQYGRIGFEAYCSQIQIRALRVCRLLWKTVDSSYTPEF
jgi:hypothetical protein